MKSYIILLITVFSTVLVCTPAFGENLGSIAINLVYTNGDIADYYPVSLKIYQDFQNTPFKEISSLSGNPFNIIGLPIGHKYKIEAYTNSMYSGIAYVDLQQLHQDTTINLALSGGMRINAFYNDKTTPISNAIVFIRSQDNKTWANSPINNLGQSLRFWISPTISPDDHYVADIKIGNNLVYSQSPIYLQAGIPQEIKVVTNWPPLVNSLVTVKLDGIQGTKDRFVVKMFDDNGNKQSESILTSRGEAYFSNMIVGDYSFVIVNQTDNKMWGSKNVTIDGSVLTFDVTKAAKITNQTEQQVTPPSEPKPVTTYFSCNCVAFRLDNVQDYWLDDVQIKIMDEFYQKNTSLTIGIIGNAFGDDIKLVNHIKAEIEKIDVGINGWNFEDFTILDEYNQTQLLKQAKTKIFDMFGVTPTVFIPPYGKANDKTFFAISYAGIQFLSSTPDIITPLGLEKKVHSLPAKISKSFSDNDSNDQLLSEIQSTINKDGFAIVTLSFQDFAQNNGTIKINIANMTKIHRVGELIDAIQSSGIKITSIKDIIGQTNSTYQIPSWIKNNAKWWSDGTITDDDFIKGIQYLIQGNVIKVSKSQSGSGSIHTIPSWIKNNAKWWSDGTITDDDFIKGIQYLVDNGIIRP